MRLNIVLFKKSPIGEWLGAVAGATSTHFALISISGVSEEILRRVSSQNHCFSMWKIRTKFFIDISEPFSDRS